MKTVADVNKRMLDYLRTEPLRARLTSMAAFEHSFEGWLKWELLYTLHQLLPNEVGVPEHLGVEWRYRRDAGPETTASKLIDLWVGQHCTAYFELNVAFSKYNFHKQVRSWRRDFSALEVVLADEPQVAGYAACMITIGEHPELPAESSEIAHGIRFCALARELAPIL